VNMASAAGTVGGLGGTAYTSSKHGVIGLTRQLAIDYGAHGIRANALCPGSIDTEMSRVFLAENPDVATLVNSVPAGRQGSPEEIARLAAFLAGDEAPFITGAVLTIDGGWTTR
jgi:3-oxoacyl-[acyl-carrier protein] reductase